VVHGFTNLLNPALRNLPLFSTGAFQEPQGGSLSIGHMVQVCVIVAIAMVSSQCGEFRSQNVSGAGRIFDQFGCSDT
jgi:hypothetical protein